jgi:hypothetical protein
MEPVVRAMEDDHGYEQDSNIGTKSRQCREEEQFKGQTVLEESWTSWSPFRWRTKTRTYW